MYAPEEKMSVIAEMASGDLIRLCQEKGIFSLENARGVGVWRDGKKLLVNCGNVIIGEGVKCHPSEFGGDYVYEAGQRVIDMDVMPLENKEAARFRNVCKGLTWKKPQYGDLLAGWCVIAAVGGCLDWRPHIFITGRKGSGKSTAMDKIVEGALHGLAIKRDGGTTEPGVRKAIGASSRPFIMDEAEAESGARRTQMQLIFEYFRNASSGAVVENANASYVARSAACFGAINPRIDQGADADRWSMLELTPNEAPDRDEHYKGLLNEIREVITDDFPDRLLSRTVANLDVLLHNIGVFVDVFSKKLGSKRAGDQVGTLVAGSYALVSNKRVTYDFVEDWVSRQDWDFGELTGGGSDADALVAAIMASRVRWDADGMGRESSIGELVWRASTRDAIGHDMAIRALGGNGIKVEDGRILISNTAFPLKRLLKDTPWSPWRRTLGDYDGADNCGGRVVYFSPGLKSKATSIPISALGLEDSGEADFEVEWE
jgi:putative DNA primase/helicase